MESSRIVLAADGLDFRQAGNLVDAIRGRLYAVKIHDLWDRHGKDMVTLLKLRGADGLRVWVDLKLHDVPKTVELRALALKDAGADIVTVHASGGVEMMKAAVTSGIDEVYAVTLLTSLGPDEVHVQYGSETSSAVVVRRLALLAKAAGVHGIVCSPQEVSLVRNAIGEGIKIVVPGVRSVGAEVHDQKRTGTH
ncbi:MAG: Orotidine 5'-phosphate decarboxylase, partial [Parcubacteria group bacterium GW2011_GWC1_41_7]